jgi:hypothetical protein
MNLQDKIILAHKGYFNSECTKSYRENSVDVCRLSTMKDYIGIIELDLRKSKDGVLYCYHGSLIEYYYDLKFPKDFSSIKAKYNVNSLAEILDVIGADKTIFLDIKDSCISKEDILNAFSKKKFKEVILGNRSVSFLSRFNGMSSEFVKILNGNIFCNFYNLKKLKRDNFKYFEVVFPFQISKKIINAVEKSGMQFRCAGLFFLSKAGYWNTIEKYGIKHISSDFI